MLLVPIQGPPPNLVLINLSRAYLVNAYPMFALARIAVAFTQLVNKYPSYRWLMRYLKKFATQQLPLPVFMFTY